MKKSIRLSLVFLFVILLAFAYITKQEQRTSRTKELTHTKNEELTNDQEPVDPEKIKIVIDPGHGGKDSGAIGASGSFEKDFTLSLSKKIAELLEEDSEVEVYMTREEDVFLSSETRDRPNIANDLNADLFISIHANTFEDPSVSGTETFYYNDFSKLLASIMHDHVIEATGYHDREVKKENYFVLRDTNMPAVLLEIGYLTNPQDELEMLTDPFQWEVAESIYRGIKEYLE